MKILLLLFIMLSCSEKQENRVIIYKQWHLSSKLDTSDIDKSKKLPQYENQVVIYDEIVKYIKEHPQKINFLSEGCQGDSKEEFKLKYNGWNIESLSKVKDTKDFKDILAPIGMKLLVKFPDKVNVYCSDQRGLVKKHLAVYSDIKGLLNYYLKFKKLNQGSLEFKRYYKSFLKLYNVDSSKIVAFIKKELLINIERFEKLLYKRNDSFIADSKKLSGTTFIVIGGLHTLNLSNRLDLLGIKNKLITPKGYNDQDDQLVSVLKSIIAKSKEIHFSSVPSNFNIKNFPMTNLLKVSNLMSDFEKKSIKKSLGENKSLFNYLLSDFDKDGIRDFTLSTSKDLVIISAEDQDWDNDGALNLVDETVGKTKVARVNRNEYEGIFTELTEPKGLINYFKKEKINLVSSIGVKHLVEVLKTFKVIYNVLDKAKYDIKNIIAMEPKYTYGKEVFFSYNKISSSLEYYPKRLIKYLKTKRSTQFKGISNKQFYINFIEPLIVHSIGHELIHSRAALEEIDLFANKWSFDEKPLNSIYLVSHRLKTKTVRRYLTNIKYDNKTYKQWLFDHKSYVKTLNLLLGKEASFIELAKTTPWYTGTSSKSKELQVSFLNYNNLVSIYSTHSPSEWVAENLAMCLFQKIYKLKKSVDLISRYEVLLGINPFGVSSKLCESFKL